MALSALREALKMFNINKRDVDPPALESKGSRDFKKTTPTPTPVVSSEPSGLSRFFSALNPFDNIVKAVPDPTPTPVRVMFREPKKQPLKVRKGQEESLNRVKITPTPTVTTSRTAPDKPQATPIPTNQENNRFIGVVAQPPQYLGDLIDSSANQYGIHPSLLAAVLLQESGYQPDRIGQFDPDDIGIAQINMKAHPDVTREQALNPDFAIPYAARLLSSHIKYFGDINRGIAAYNRGRGGANRQGDTPFGGDQKGQDYLDAVAGRMSEEFARELGLKVTSF